MPAERTLIGAAAAAARRRGAPRHEHAAHPWRPAALAFVVLVIAALGFRIGS